MPDNFYLRDFLAIDMIMSEGPAACSYPGWLRKEEEEITRQLSFAIRSGIVKWEGCQNKEVFGTSDVKKALHEKALDMKFNPVLGCWHPLLLGTYLT